jgi:hypothetical protein
MLNLNNQYNIIETNPDIKGLPRAAKAAIECFRLLALHCVLKVLTFKPSIIFQRLFL